MSHLSMKSLLLTQVIHPIQFKIPKQQHNVRIIHPRENTRQHLSPRLTIKKIDDPATTLHLSCKAN